MRGLFWSIIAVVLLNACSGDNKKFKSEIDKKHDFHEIESCPRVNFYNSFLAKENLLELFDCVGWAKEYPKLGQLIKTLPLSYDSVASKMNANFFETLDSRKNFFDLLARSSQMGTFDHMALLLEHMISNVHMDKILEHAMNDGIYLEIVKHENYIKNFMHIYLEISGKLKFTPDVWSSIEDIQEIKDQTYASIIESVTNKESFDDLTSFVFHEDWPANFLGTFSTDDLQKLLNAPVSKRQDLYESAKLVARSIDEGGVVCHGESGRYVFQHDLEVADFIDSLNGEKDNLVLQSFLNLFQKFSFFKDVCDSLESHYFSKDQFVSSSQLLLEIAQDILALPGGFDLTKQVVRSIYGFSLKDKFKLIDILKSESFKNYLEYVYQLNQTENGRKYIEEWLSLIKSMSPSFFEKLANILTNGADASFTENLLNYWKQLPEINQQDLINMIHGLYRFNGDYKKVNFILNEGLKLFPEILDIVNDDPHAYVEILNHLLIHNDVDIRNELINFLKNDEIRRILSMMQVTANSELPVQDSIRYIYRDGPGSVERDCFEWVGRKLEQDVNFWNLLDDYPESCAVGEHQEFSGLIYQWTNGLDSEFVTYYGRNFSRDYGLISPYMMRYYLRLMFIVDAIVEHENEDYVYRVANRFKEILFQDGVANLVDKVAVVVRKIDDEVNFFDHSMKKISGSDLSNLEIDKENFGEIMNWILYPRIPKKLYANCSTIIVGTGAKGCLSNVETFDLFLRLKAYLLKKNGSSPTLLSSILNAIYHGASVPFGSRSKYKLGLKEFVSLLYDITDVPTRKKIVYTDNAEKKSFKTLRMSERLELLIREANFLNNFYGAYFINTLGRADNYSGTVNSVEQQLKLMDMTDGFFRNQGIFPADTERRFKNMIAAYSSLKEVAYLYTQPDGSRKNYSHFVQGLLSLTIESSASNSRDFSPFQRPNPSLVNKHNGKFITELTNFSVLSRLGLFLHKNFPKRADVLNNRMLNKVDARLFEVISRPALEGLVEYILRSQHLNSILADLINIATDDDYSDKMAAIGWDFLEFIVSAPKNYWDEFVPTLKVVIDNYPKLKNLINLQMLRDEKIKMLDTIFAFSENTNISTFSYAWVADLHRQEASGIKRILREAPFYDALRDVVGAWREINQSNGREYLNFINDFVTHELFTLSSLRSMLLELKRRDGNLDYVSQVLKYMVRDNQGRTKVYRGLHQLALEQQRPLSSFLKNIFQHIELVN